jgi:adenosylhomocysteine nucleosidase
VGEVEIHLIETGVGPACAREVSEAVLFSLAPGALISTGYAGALGPADIGEVVLGTKTLDWTREKTKQEIQADSALLESARRAARDAGIVWSQGAVVTVEQVVWRASEKQALGEVSGAIAVDMESAAIAKVASAAGIPFLLVRGVSDRVGDDLPMDFNVWFSSFGSLRCFLQIMKKPSILHGLYEMELHANQASANLREFFRALFSILESHIPPPGAGIPLTAGAR